VKRRMSALALALLGTLLAAGCSGGKSYAVVTVRGASPDFPNVAQFAVYLTNGPTRKDTLYYPRSPAGPYRVSPTDTIDFSVGFSSSYLGDLTVGVVPRDTFGNSMGYGETVKPIEPGEVMRLEVVVVKDALPPDTIGDGGLPPPCEPSNANACGAGNTCYVRCFGNTGVGSCTAAGTGQAGLPCTTSAECAPGLQCFEYSCGKICMKFCKTDGECGGGRCTVNVPCGGRATVHKACTLPCDPRGDGLTGCSGGLRCYLFDEEVPGCDCQGANKEEGQPCQNVRDCQPGHLCVEMENAARVCRPLCRLADGVCPPGRTCTPLVKPDYKTWGACVPP
jgi:hypothetical protein